MNFLKQIQNVPMLFGWSEIIFPRKKNCQQNHFISQQFA